MIYGKDIDQVLIKRTDNLLEDIRNFLSKLLNQEQIYKIRVDCIQKNMGGAIGGANALNTTRIPTLSDINMIG